MTGTDLCVNKCKQSRSYLNHLVVLFSVYLYLYTVVLPVYTVQYSDHACKPVYRAPLPSHQIHHKVYVLFLPPRPRSNNLGPKNDANNLTELISEFRCVSETQYNKIYRIELNDSNRT